LPAARKHGARAGIALMLGGRPRFGAAEGSMRIMTLPCDGIGPEIMAATLEAMDAANSKFGLGLEFEEEAAGFASLDRYGTTLREEVLQRAGRDCDGVILGPQSHMDYPPVAEGGRNVSAAFRVGLDLYANIRPARSRPFIA